MAEQALQPPQIHGQTPSQIALVQATWTICIDQISYFSAATPDRGGAKHLGAKQLDTVLGNFLESTQDILFCLDNIWFTIFWLAKQIPHDNLGHDAIVSLVMDLRDIPQRPELVNPTEYEQNIGEDGWICLPQFRYVWERYVRGAPIVPSLAERLTIAELAPDKTDEMVSLSASNWTNLHSFLARLVTSLGTRVDLDDKKTSPRLGQVFFSISAQSIYTLIDALEEQEPRLLPAAACWILYAGERLRSFEVLYAQGVERQYKRFPFSAGDLYSGEVGFNDERWNFWKSRFEALRNDADPDRKAWAEKAFQKMTEIDQHYVPKPRPDDWIHPADLHRLLNPPVDPSQYAPGVLESLLEEAQQRVEQDARRSSHSI